MFLNKIKLISSVKGGRKDSKLLNIFLKRIKKKKKNK